VISGFRHKVDGIYTLQGYYTAYSRNSLLTSQDSVSDPSSKGHEIQKSRNFLCLEDGTDTVSQTISMELPLNAAQ